MSTLTEFLLARVAEDEAIAKALDSDGYAVTAAEIAFQERFTSARVLAEADAKRRIVTEHELMPVRQASYGLLDGCCIRCTAHGEYGGPSVDGTPDPCLTLRVLALPYADHPDYLQEWRH